MTVLTFHNSLFPFGSFPKSVSFISFSTEIYVYDIIVCKQLSSIFLFFNVSSFRVYF